MSRESAKTAGMTKWLLAALLLALAWAALSPFITVYQMRSAAAERDGERLAQYIEFPSLRDNLKDQLNDWIAREAAGRTEDEWLSSAGGLLAGLVVDKAVDALVTPAVIIRLMKGEVPDIRRPRRRDEDQPPRKPFGGARYRYDGWDRFSIIVPDRHGQELRFVLRRRGLGWRLTAIRIPLPGSETRSSR